VRIADTIEQSLILILSDINMPGMTGLEMLPKVKKLRPDVPFIMITAYGDADTKRKAIESGQTACSPSRSTSPCCGRKSTCGWSANSGLEKRGIVERLDHRIHHVGGAVVLALLQKLPHLAQVGAHRRLQRGIAFDQGPGDAEGNAFTAHPCLLDGGFAHGGSLSDLTCDDVLPALLDQIAAEGK